MIVCVAILLEGNLWSGIFTVPDVPNNFTVIVLNDSSVQLSWQPERLLKSTTVFWCLDSVQGTCKVGTRTSYYAMSSEEDNTTCHVLYNLKVSGVNWIFFF